MPITVLKVCGGWWWWWVVFHWRSFSTEGCLPPKAVTHPKSSSTKGRLPPRVVFHQGLSSTKGCLSPKVVFHRRSSSTEGVFHQRASSTEGRLSPKVVFHRRSSSTYHNTLVDLIFVRTVNIPNISLLPCLEVANFFFMKRTNEWTDKPYIEAACCVKRSPKRLT